MWSQACIKHRRRPLPSNGLILVTASRLPVLVLILMPEQEVELVRSGHFTALTLAPSRCVTAQELGCQEQCFSRCMLRFQAQARHVLGAQGLDQGVVHGLHVLLLCRTQIYKH
jgi:hypothetical protein